MVANAITAFNTAFFFCVWTFRGTIEISSSGQNNHTWQIGKSCNFHSSAGSNICCCSRLVPLTCFAGQLAGFQSRLFLLPMDHVPLSRSERPDRPPTKATTTFRSPVYHSIMKTRTKSWEFLCAAQCLETLAWEKPKGWKFS